MRRPLLIAGVLLMVLGAAALVLRWQLARGADALLDELRAALAPQATLSWRATVSGFDGRLGARELVLTPKRGGPKVTIDALAFDAGGLGATLAAIAPWSRPELPPRLRIELSGVRVALTPPLATAATTETTAIGLDALAVVPCGGLDGMGVLRALADDPVVFDADLGWVFDAPQRKLALWGALRSRELADLELDLELDARDAVAGLAGFAQARPVARRGALTLTEHGGFKRSATLCAAHSAIEREAWLAANLDGATELLESSGIEPSSGLRAGWRAFRAAPERLRLAFDNPALHGADGLAARDPRELADMFALRIEFNDVAVDDAGFTLTGAQQLEAAAPLADAPRDAKGGEPLAETSVRVLLAPLIGSAPTAPRRAAPSRSTTAARTTTITPNRSDATTAVGAPLTWEALGGQRGRPVVVRMHDGRVLEGVLREVSPWRLTLERRIGGGSAVLPLAREDVARVYAGR